MGKPNWVNHIVENTYLFWISNVLVYVAGQAHQLQKIRETPEVAVFPFLQWTPKSGI